jgi:Arc/MetJ family transcription regulator
MRERTTMNLDRDLVREAAKALGTKTATETVHRALEEAAHREHRLRLARRSFDELSGEKLDALRRPRSAPAV